MGSGVASAVGGVVKVVVGLVAVVLVLTVVLVVVPGAFMDGVRDRLGALNPFATETVDRTGPSVQLRLTDLSEYRAASAYYETVVDLEEDNRILPDFIDGERILYVGKGQVAASVDFTDLDERRVELSEDGTAATITLPAPVPDEPELDIEASTVVLRDRGFVNRFQGSDQEREAQLRAIEQMTAAAAEGDNLIALAEQNTTSMLQGLLGALGYTDVTVTFDDA